MRRPALVLLIGALAVAAAPAEAGGEFAFSAKVDKSTVEAGTPMTLVITLTGDITGVQLPKIQLPDGFAVGGTSQASNFSLQNGAMQRSVGLTYVLVPQTEGVFQLGPFTVRRGREEFKTESIEITVTKPPMQKRAIPEGERFIL